MIKNLTSSDINKNDQIKKKFLNANYRDLNLKCNIFHGNFYLDTFNYFLIDDENYTFSNLFTRDSNQSNHHYYTRDFFDHFTKNKSNFKVFQNTFVLGSNAANNYYSNLLQFLPRMLFINNNEIKIAIHRNSSTKFRNFIKLVLDSKNIKYSFVFLDDNFYKFENCKIPQFLEINRSIKTLKELIIPNKKKTSDSKIYITREDSSYRKIINESDIIPILQSKGYKVINPQLYEIDEQIQIFSQAEKIIAPHGSNLSNIIFCKPKTEIYEIGPYFSHDYEKVFEDRYKNLANICDLKYSRFLSDTVDVKEHSDIAKKYIDKNILEQSSYYRNLIVKVSDISNID